MVLSLILGLISWMTSLFYIVKRKGRKEKYIILSYTFTILALINEIFFVQRMAVREDIVSFLDIGVCIFYPAIILVLVTSILNFIIYLIKD